MGIVARRPINGKQDLYQNLAIIPASYKSCLLDTRLKQNRRWLGFFPHHCSRHPLCSAAPSLSPFSQDTAPSCRQAGPCPPADSTFTKAAAARKLILATDSRFRRRGRRLKPERELVKEQSDVAPGVIGVCGMLQPSLSSAIRKARPRAKGSMICQEKQPVSPFTPKPFPTKPSLQANILSP